MEVFDGLLLFFFRIIGEGGKRLAFGFNVLIVKSRFFGVNWIVMK